MNTDISRLDPMTYDIKEAISRSFLVRPELFSGGPFLVRIFFVVL